MVSIEFVRVADMGGCSPSVECVDFEPLERVDTSESALDAASARRQRVSRTSLPQSPTGCRSLDRMPPRALYGSELSNVYARVWNDGTVRINIVTQLPLVSALRHQQL